MRIEIPVFDGFDELDAIGPFEVLRNATRFGARWDVVLVGADGPGEVTAAHGLRLAVDDGLGRPDAVLVPGGGWLDRDGPGCWQQARQGRLPEALAAIAPTAAWTASVCTGAMLLAEAGLLSGRPATTHRDALADLAVTGALPVEGARVVDDGDLLTAAGVTSGLDLALWLVEREHGGDTAAAVSREMEYERRGEVTRIRR